MKTAAYWIDNLELLKHPEGGYFKEVYRSDEIHEKHALAGRYGGDRNYATSIYFLLEGHEFSSFHRIQSDETWHFYQGTTLELYVLTPVGLNTILLGQHHEEGEVLQVTIPRDHWFGARVKEANSYALLGCTVAPGFDFNDFELGNRKELTQEYPAHAKLIEELTF